VKYLFDTDHVTFLQRHKGAEFVALSAKMARHSPSDFALSVVSLHEQALGANAYISRAKTPAGVVTGYQLMGQVIESFNLATVLPFDVAASTEIARLRAQRIRVGTMDLRIASIALANKLTLLTRNVADFGKVPGLTTEDWTV